MKEGYLFLKMGQKKPASKPGSPSQPETRRMTRAMINKRFYFFLFNDVVVVCGVKPKASNTQSQHIQIVMNPNATNTPTNNNIVIDEEGEPQFTFAEYMFMRDVVEVDIGPPKEEREWMKQLQMCTFHIATEQVSWTVTTKTIEERDSWCSTIQQLCNLVPATAATQDNNGNHNTGNPVVAAGE